MVNGEFTNTHTSNDYNMTFYAPTGGTYLFMGLSVMTPNIFGKISGGEIINQEVIPDGGVPRDILFSIRRIS
jgi:hypothetical protein